MVVLQINKFFFEKGGTERYFFALGRSLEQRGHDVVHFSMQHPRNRASKWSEWFVPNEDYGAPRLRNRVSSATRFVHNRRAAESLRGLIRSHRPDVAHLHNIYHQLTPSIIDVLADAGVPAVMTLHDYKLLCPSYSLFTQGAFCDRCVGGRFYHAAMRRCGSGGAPGGILLALEAYWQKTRGVYDRVAHFIAPSRSLRDRHVGGGLSPQRVTHVPPFIPDGGFAPVADAPCRSPREPESGGGALRVVYAGRLSPEKGVETLIEAVSRVPDLHLTVCGDGPLRPRLEEVSARVAPGRVRFRGFVDPAEVVEVLRGADCSVLPTLSPENAPYAVLEAASLGVPVVVSDMGGLPEMAAVVEGFVFAHGNVRELAETFRGIVRDPTLARARGERGREKALEFYNEDKHVASIEAIYSRAVEGP